MSDTPTTIAPADLAAVRIAALEARAAAAAADVLRLSLFLRYGMTVDDSFDYVTGVITRAAPSPEPTGG